MILEEERNIRRLEKKKGTLVSFSLYLSKQILTASSALAFEMLPNIKKINIDMSIVSSYKLV